MPVTPEADPNLEIAHLLLIDVFSTFLTLENRGLHWKA
jgi:hypothetical protein